MCCCSFVARILLCFMSDIKLRNSHLLIPPISFFWSSHCWYISHSKVHGSSPFLFLRFTLCIRALGVFIGNLIKLRDSHPHPFRSLPEVVFIPPPLVSTVSISSWATLTALSVFILPICSRMLSALSMRLPAS